MKKVFTLTLCALLIVLSSCQRDDDCDDIVLPIVMAQAKVISDYPWPGVSPQFYAKVVFEGKNLNLLSNIDLENYIVKVSSVNYTGEYNITINKFYKHEGGNSERVEIEFFGPYLYQYPNINQTDIDQISAQFVYYYNKKKQIIKN